MCTSATEFLRVARTQAEAGEESPRYRLSCPSQNSPWKAAVICIRTRAASNFSFGVASCEVKMVRIASNAAATTDLTREVGYLLSLATSLSIG